ncbi:MAG: hypothetical protein ABIS50_25820 [Luteolibacter sp.]|uniref:hypothetical protein n=1 Tax=Luteolibacter sp. TaxID=1962973 RepID=UPI0032646CD0
MKGNYEDFKTGWIGVHIGIKNSEIDDLIDSLKKLRNSRIHFHLRSSFEGDSGIADVEIFSLEEGDASNLELDSSGPVYCEEELGEAEQNAELGR